MARDADQRQVTASPIGRFALSPVGVNGLVLPQGATAAPEVVIEEIRARSATFNFRGTRFRVGF